MSTFTRTAVSTQLPLLLPATAVAAVVAVACISVASAAVARADYSDTDFEACMNRNMPTDYCCEHAGGVMRGGACIDPATLRMGPVQTSSTRRPLPGVAPPATAVNPGTAG